MRTNTTFASNLLLPKLQANFEQLGSIHIAEDRLPVLDKIISYLDSKIQAQEAINLLFVCVHNSRRSIIAQLWAQAMSYAYNIPMNIFSGGTEVTAFNPRAAHIMRNLGFKCEDTNGDNPIYSFKIADYTPEVTAYSKLHNDDANPKENFAAIMVCGEAETNCPFVPGCEKRLMLPFEDPKAYDDTELESIMYRKRALQIGSEINYIFSRLGSDDNRK